MKLVIRLALALMLTAAALVPGSSQAAFPNCDPSRCFNLNCPQSACPPGQVNFPRCSLQYCYFYCACITVPPPS